MDIFNNIVYSIFSEESEDILPLSSQEYEAGGGWNIRTGEKGKLYTLRHDQKEYFRTDERGGTGSFMRSYHVRNLGKDWDDVVQRLPTILQKYGSPPWKVYIPGWVGGRLEGNDPAQAVDNVTIPDHFEFGKYRGRTIEEVKKIDPKYLIWIALNFTPSPNKPGLNGFIQNIQDAMSDELNALKQEEDEKKNKQKNVAELLKPYVDVIKNTWYAQYYRWAIDSLEEGNHDMPDKAINTAMDVYAKTFGRRNSKPYNTAYDEFDDVLRKADELMGIE